MSIFISVFCKVNAMEEINISLPWLLLTVCCVLFLVLFVFLCVCWRTKKYKNLKSSYVMETGKSHTLAHNNVPHIITSEKQKYFSHNNVSYSSINQNHEFSKNNVPNENISFNILNLFRHIQKCKYPNEGNDLTKVFTEDLEESNTELMIKKFDKSILCLNWNDNSDDSNEPYIRVDDETYSCISNDSKATFKSIVPQYTRSHSIAETFKSIDSEN